MRMIAFAAALATLASPAGAATRNFGITGFTKIRVEGPYRVNLTTGVPPFARANGSAAGLDRVTLEMRGDTLVVRTSQSWGGSSPGASPGPVEISVGTHELGNAFVFGSGALGIDAVKGLAFTVTVLGSGVVDIGRVAADQLNVNIDGSGGARLRGSARRLSAEVRGLGTLDARGLSVPNAAISADGTTTVDAEVTETARIDAAGMTTVRLGGQPSCTVKASGSAIVEGCKASQ